MFIKTKIEIAYEASELRTVEGYLLKGSQLACHKAVDGLYAWTVSHITTGRHVASFSRLRDAKFWIQQMRDFFIESTDNNKIMDHLLSYISKHDYMDYRNRVDSGFHDTLDERSNGGRPIKAKITK